MQKGRWSRAAEMAAAAALVMGGAWSAAAGQNPDPPAPAPTLLAQATKAVDSTTDAKPEEADRNGTKHGDDPKEKSTDASDGPSEADPAQSPDTGGFAGFFRSTELTGFVDGYYGWNTHEQGPAQLRNFDVNHNEFSFNLAELALERKVSVDGRVGFRLDIDAGPAADMVNAFEPGGTEFLRNVQQGYVSYLAPLGRGLQIDVGKFVTPHGAEVIETRDNWNYSRGLLFALAIPYYHMGARLAYPVTDKVTVTGFIVNGWNNVRENNDAKSFGAQLLVKPTEKLSIIQNYMAGAEQAGNDDDIRHLLDTVVSYTLTEKVSLLANYDFARDTFEGLDVQWQGIAAYARYQGGERWAISPRFEWFDDRDGFATGVDQTVKDVTLTGEYKLGGLVTRLEYRTDFTDTPFFEKGTSLKKTQTTITFGFLYGFSSR